MKNLAEQIRTLMERKNKARESYHASFEKEAKQLGKRLGLCEDEITYNVCFNAYLGDEYPTDNEGNDKPFKRPTSLSKYTIIYLYVEDLPHIREKAKKWVNLINEIEEVKKLVK